LTFSNFAYIIELMDLFISVDPGKRHCGIAEWDKNTKELQSCVSIGTLEAFRTLAGLPSGPTGITDASSRITGVMEIPQQYPGSATRVEDLIQLAASAGAIAAHIGGTWTQARPGIWTRQWCQDKAIRLERAWARLSPVEQSRVTLPKNKERQADVLDAIALGLWALKR
jgi:hypothetical protein